jgi:hypothetical protein
VSDRRQPPAPTSALLGDLESIRSLLAEQQAAEGQRDSMPDDEVPLLEDVVQGGVSVNEAFLSGESDFGESDSGSGLPDDIFQALLSDEWRESTDQLVEEARAELGNVRAEPDTAEALNEALKLHVDETLQRWLRALVLSNIDDLRRELLEAVRQQLGETVATRFNEQSPEEDTDGA